MKTDREFLELAAKAIGSEIKWAYDFSCCWIDGALRDYDNAWNPLTDDGDALRLAVKLNMHVMVSAGAARESWNNGIYGEVVERDNLDLCATTRRAIVRAAAAIGEHMQ